MTNHVPTLETCQKLKEAGFPQESLFSWWQDITLANMGKNSYLTDLSEGGGWDWNYERLCRAPILTEILEQLPVNTEVQKREQGYIAMPPGDYFSRFEKNPAEAAALLWLKLQEANA